ncbi:hypothetical protein [Hathewaya massiliensis]|uniref:hypothetical protein n=1 Tax=Hathewaya massiliensis TaxID=1964382 RepID=UPI0011586E88|nr:hypothetical protein [Hathewaya massiliensis]
MDKMSKKVVSLVVLGTMLGGQVVYATSNTQEGNLHDKIKKDESVYVTLTEKGEVKEKIVSDWIHSDKANIEIKDKSELKDIENVKGDEKPETNGESLVWKTDKNDIYYRGKTDKELPLDVKLTYELDGKEVSPKDIVGKSGKLKITLKVINKDAHKVTVKGKEKTIYTPFSSVSVINLPLDNFTNVKVNTGEVISDGNNQVVTFISLPGMKESLDLDENTLDVELKDTLELTCDTKDFQMGPIMVTATAKLPEELKEVKEAKNIDELTDGLNKMKDAGDKLVDGTSKLSEGAKLMSDKIALLNSAYSGLDAGISTVNSGSRKLYEGANKLSTGTSMLSKEVNNIEIPDMNGMKNQVNTLGEGISQVDAGANQLASKLPEMQQGTGKLLNGAKQVNGGLDGVNKGLNDLYQGQLKQEEAIKQLVQGITQMEGLIASMPEGQQKEILKGGLAKQKAALQQIQTEAVGGTKQGIQKLQGGVSQIKKGMDNADPNNPGLVQGLSVMNTKIPEAVEGSKKLAQGTTQLKQGFAKGMAAIDEKLKAVDPSKIVMLKEATKQLDAGANELKNGLGQLSSGSDKLKDGSSKMTTGISALKDGSSTLAEKSGELKDGMAKFDEEGIKEMDNKLGSKVRDAEDILATKDEVVKLGENYKTFAGAGEEMEGSVKFIMKTDEIEKKKEEKKEEVKKEEKGFFQKIADFFKGKEEK